MQVDVLTTNYILNNKFLTKEKVESDSLRTIHMSVLSGRIFENPGENTKAIILRTPLRGVVKAVSKGNDSKVRIFGIVCEKYVTVLNTQRKKAWLYSFPIKGVPEGIEDSEELLRKTFVKAYFSHHVNSTHQIYKNTARLIPEFWNRFIWSVLPKHIEETSIKFHIKHEFGGDPFEVILNRLTTKEDIIHYPTLDKQIILNLNHHPKSINHSKFLLI